MRKYFFIVATLIFSGFLFNSCSNDEDFDSPTPKNANPTATLLEKDKSMARFSEILSKSAYEKKEVRDFLKSQALEKFDNGYNVFYSIVKDKMVDGTNTFKDVLASYANNKEELENIEKAVPLLNIHIPEFIDQKVSDIDTQDQEIPILQSNNLYLNGAVVDTLGQYDIPAFALFVVDESGSVQKKSNNLKSSNSALSINNDYEFVSPAFSPALTKQNMLKTSGTEVLSKKYQKDGWVPKSDIDPVLLSAYNSSTNNLRATRSMVYYGMSTPNQNPNTMRSDVKDCLFRFKIAGDAFERLESIATDNGKNPLFNGSTRNKKSALSREEVLKRLLTGRAFCFMFRIEGVINGQTVVSEGMNVYVTPEKLFNLNINESRRHATAFRHSKYTYSINKNNVEEKWFYPMDYGHDTRLNSWDIAYQPIEKKVVAYLVDPNDGQTKSVTENYTVTYVTSNEVGANISGKIKEIITIGINGKVNSSTTTTKQVTTTYTVNYKNLRLDEFQFNFFDDYPIERVVSNGEYIIPIRKGKGIVETSIMPITNDFFTYKRFH